MTYQHQQNTQSLCSSLTPLQANAFDLSRELAWCEQVIDQRLKLCFNQQTDARTVFDFPPPEINQSQSAYGQFIVDNELDFLARLMLIVALLPAVKPQALDVFLTCNELTNRPFTEFGCVEHEGNLYPSGETLAFIVGDHDLALRFMVQSMLQSKPQAPVVKLLQPLCTHHDPLLMTAPLQLKPLYLHWFTTGLPYRPDLSEDFPAKLVSVDMDWDDVVLPKEMISQLEEIQAWITHGATLMDDWGLGKKLRPGYRALFYGPPGTGKTLTACLLAKTCGREVYRVDLSLVISKYIGETEKNLEKIFSLAEDKSWMLFFDEADALFGKRIQTAGANDQFANQNVAYLLQRIESYNGIVILASNLKDNFDPAFFRRFESMVYFPLPDGQQRLQLWQQGLSARCSLAENVNLQTIATHYPLCGASIMNVIRFVSLRALTRGDNIIRAEDIAEGISREDPQPRHRRR